MLGTKFIKIFSVLFQSRPTLFVTNFEIVPELIFGIGFQRLMMTTFEPITEGRVAHLYEYEFSRRSQGLVTFIRTNYLLRCWSNVKYLAAHIDSFPDSSAQIIH